MQWKPNPPPTDRSTRTRTVFALFPTEMDDGTYVWLETYILQELYKVWAYPRREAFWVVHRKVAIDKKPAA